MKLLMLFIGGLVVCKVAQTKSVRDLREYYQDHPEEHESEDTFESDMKLTPLKKIQLEASVVDEKMGHNIQKRKATSNLDLRWPNGVVPYVISDEFGGVSAVIQAAMQHWMDETCLTFVPRNTERDYLNFIKRRWCASLVGWMGGQQNISIGDNCNQFGTIVHEIGHAIGFEHEHQRPDRDKYVIINNENKTYHKYSWDQIVTHEIPYDIGSIMHYGPNTFTAIQPGDNSKLGQRRGLSSADIRLANAIYHCQCEKLITDDKIYYRYIPSPINAQMIEFEAQVNNDVHIALSSAADDAQQNLTYYEIEIGGSRIVSCSFIRRCMQLRCTQKFRVSTPGYLNTDESRGFWISFDQTTGLIKVGKKGEAHFMQWQDPNPLNVTYLGYSTGRGSIGLFTFPNPKCEKLTTDTNFYYRYIPSPINTRIIEFEAQANNDVHIALTSAAHDAQQMYYEIIIGGSHNTRSFIRRCTQLQCTLNAIVSTPGYLSADELRGFWIYYEETTGLLLVGSERNEPFIYWQDRNPIHVKYLGYSTGWGSDGLFTFHNPKCEKLTSATDAKFYYRYIPSPINAQTIEFEAQANNDVHIALASAADDAQQMHYEIVIGGSRNTRSFIKRCMQLQCLRKVRVSTPGYLSANESRGFWISYDQTTGLLKVGKKREAHFMQWQDPNPLDVMYLGYSTGWGSIGLFTFRNPKCEKRTTDSKFHYRGRYIPLSVKSQTIEFEAQANNDVHISLTSFEDDAQQMNYEIVIGGSRNTRSFIKRCMQLQCTREVRVSTPGYLSANESRGFWISYDQMTGLLKVGKKGEAHFMQWQDPNPLYVTYFGYSTGWGSNGLFTFCHL